MPSATAAKQSGSCFVACWIAARSLSSGAHSRDPLARNDVERSAATSPRHCEFGTGLRPTRVDETGFGIVASSTVDGILGRCWQEVDSSLMCSNSIASWTRGALKTHTCA